jgi:hypothetical protein
MTTSHVEHPDPINQFFHLAQDTPGGPWRKTTPWNDVILGHDFDAEDCMAAQGVVMIDAHTGGRIHSTAHDVRLASGDTKGGIGVDDVQRAAMRLYGLSILTPADYSWADTIHSIRSERRHVGVGVQYNVMPDSVQYQLPGIFPHAIGLDDYRDSDGYLLVYDSLGTGPVWRPQSAVRAAAEKLATENGRSAGQLFAMVSASRPALDTTVYRADLPDYAFWVYTTDNRPFSDTRGVRYDGTITGRKDYVRGGGSSVPVLPPTGHFYAWPGHTSRRLVQITKGIYDGRFVQAGYAHPA